MFFTAIQRNVIRLSAINRVESVNRRKRAIIASSMITAILIIDPHQQTMINRPGIHAAVELIIQRDSRHFLPGAGIAAIQRRFIQPTCGIDLIQRHFGMQIAQFLPYRPAVIEQMLNVITHHIFTAIVFVVVIFTFKESVRNFSAVIRYNRALIRQSGVATALRITVQIGHKIKTRPIGNSPGQARHQRITFLFQGGKLRIGVTCHAAKTRRHTFIVIQWAGHIKSRPALVVIAGKQLHFSSGIKRRFSRRQRDNAAWR